MKPTSILSIRPLLAFALLPGLLLTASCSKKAPASGGGSGGPSPAADASLPAVTVAISANDQMKFDVTAIAAKPGQKVRITLRNAGTMPKVSMGHNLVVLALGTDPEKFIEASQMQMANDYIAPEMRASVIAHTRLLGPGESDTVEFAAPRAPGSYPFVCSFPGHYAIGMKGVLTVR